MAVGMEINAIEYELRETRRPSRQEELVRIEAVEP